MANTASAIKRVRSNNRKRIVNKMVRSKTRTAIRKVEDSTPEELRASTIAAISALDRAAKKGVIHRNKASRSKSRLMKRLNAQAAAK